MDASISNLFTEIHVEKEIIRAAMCQRCGAKIHPPKLLRLHLHYHQAKDLFVAGELKKLQAAMGKMK